MRWAAISLLLISHPVAAAAPELGIASIRAPVPPHCMAAEQWRDPAGTSPLNLFDGNPRSGWTLCPEATQEAAYTIEVRLVAPIQIDALRVILAPQEAHGRPTRVDVAFFNSQYSSQLPIYFRELGLEGDREAYELALAGPLRWNPRLRGDADFGERRRALKLGATVPLPLTIDRLSLTLRSFVGASGVGASGEQPVWLGEVELLLDERPLPARNLSAARAAHVAFLAAGLERLLRGNYLVGPKGTLGLGREGQIWIIGAAQWAAGVGMPGDERVTKARRRARVASREAREAAVDAAIAKAKLEARKRHRKIKIERKAIAAEVAAAAPGGPPPKLGGAWQIAGGRLEMGRGKRQAAVRYAAVRYLVDRAPALIALRSGPFAGDYRLAVLPPGLRLDPMPQAPGLATTQLGPDPASDVPQIPIP